MQVIEKVKVVPEGYNGAGMDGYNRRDVNGKANAGLTLGIIGTAVRRSEATVNGTSKTNATRCYCSATATTRSTTSSCSSQSLG